MFLFFKVFSELLVEVIFSLLFALMMRTRIFRKICFVPRCCNIGDVPFERIAPSTMCCGSGPYGLLDREEAEDPSAEGADLAFSRPAVQEEKLHMQTSLGKFEVFIEHGLSYEIQ